MKIAWLAPDGSTSKAGDVVVRFDPTSPEKQLRDGEADLAAAERAARRGAASSGKVAIGARDTRRDAGAGTSSSSTRKFQSKDEEIFSRNQIVESQIDETLATAQGSSTPRSTKTDRAQPVAQSKTGLIAVERQKAQLAIAHAKTALEQHGDQGAARRPLRAPAQLARRGAAGRRHAVAGPEASPRFRCSTRWRPRCSCSRSTAAGSPRGQPADVIVEARPGHDLPRQDPLGRQAREAARPATCRCSTSRSCSSSSKTDREHHEAGPARPRDARRSTSRTRSSCRARRSFNKDGKNLVYRADEAGGFEPVAGRARRRDVGPRRDRRAASPPATRSRCAIRRASLDQALGSSDADDRRRGRRRRAK